MDVEQLESEGLDPLEHAVEGCLVDGAAESPANASMSVSLSRPRTVIS